MRVLMFFRKFSLLALLLIVLSSCGSLREHIRQRQLETHGPPRKIKDYQEHETTKQEKPDKNNKDEIYAENTNNTIAKYSKKWDVSLPKNADEQFLHEIDSWLGVPYVYGGESKKGTDCSGMIQTIYKKIYNISLQRSARGMQEDVSFIPLHKAKIGDILFFKINFKTVGHVALYLGDRRFIHATVSRGVMISCLDELYYSKRYYKCGRIKAMNR